MPVQIKSNGVCPKCFSANFWQTAEPKLFYCEDCKITFELLPLQEVVERIKQGKKT